MDEEIVSFADLSAAPVTSVLLQNNRRLCIIVV